MGSIIEIQNVTKKFKANLVLSDVNLTCEPGHIYGIVGYNGCGKSVLFKCICGLYRVNEGKICVDGKEIGKDIDILHNAGIIIEEPAFLKQYSGLMNLELLYGLRNKKDREYLRETLKKVGLDPEEKKAVGKYSLGMKQRLGIAQAIMEDPDILILDEPMNGLDKEGVEEIRKLLLAERDKEKTILLASHNSADIEILCDEVYYFNHGTLQKDLG